MKSVIHRRAYMDYVGIKRFDDHGNVIGELRVVGLFTSTAYTQPALEIPLLRSKVEKVIRNFGYSAESHSGKTLINVLESYPRDDLFQIDVTHAFRLLRTDHGSGRPAARPGACPHRPFRPVRIAARLCAARAI